MIEQTGVVVALQDEFAEVQALRQGACGSCSATGACGVSLIDRVLGRRRLHLRVLNDIGAQVGDRIVLGVPESALLRAALAAYLVPLMSLIAGAILGRESAALSQLLAPEPASIAGGLIGFVLALRWLRVYSQRLAADPRWRAIMLRRDSESIDVQLS